MPDLDITCAEMWRDLPILLNENKIITASEVCKAIPSAASLAPRRTSHQASVERSGVAVAAASDRERFEIVCDQCGKSDAVPFKPQEGRPILCGECFSASRAQSRST
jgi:CxxC-x17-CxxC domain-containing protein